MRTKTRSFRVLALMLSLVLVLGLIGGGIPARAEGTDLTGEELARLIVPVVQEYTLAQTSGTWTMTTGTRLMVLATQENLENERLAEVVELVNAEFMEKEVVSADPFAMVYGNAEDQTSADVLIKMSQAPTADSDSAEAYTITISENGVVIDGASENAVMYALRTIQHYMVALGYLPYGTIVDYPDVAERRLHVDCARKYISKDWFIRQIREMSFLKMNAIQIHFSENLGFRIECETDPAIVSDEYLTKAEIREILAEAEKYGVKVIPSFDSPGHVDQILKAHPQYGQVNSSGEHYASGLDVTNPEAVAYIYSLYDEYMELFEGCTDFHIGGDEYMEFDRAPFTTEYKSVLNEYAVEKYGAGATWKDAIAGYINDLAAHVYEQGFIPRIWNDGIYYGENSSWEAKQTVEMHKYIGIDFWSQMSWNPSIANLQTFIDKGHETIYNINASYFYYVLRNDMPTDGREQHSFDVLDQDKNIFENWTPGQFQSNTIDDDHPYIKGAAMGIWCDNPDLCDEDTITSDIADELRSLASKSWNVSSSDGFTFEEFKANYTVLGNVAGFEKGSELPDAGQFQNAESLGKVTMKYVDEEGNAIRADVVKYGNVGDSYTFTAEAVYGYKLVGEGTVSGTYTAEGDIYTFTFQLYTDKTALQAELNAPLTEADYIPETYAAYKTALEAAKIVNDKAGAHQSEVDGVLEALLEAKAQAVALEDYALYVQVTYPMEDIGYSTGYSEYLTAVEAGEEALYGTGGKEAALAAIMEAIDDLALPVSGTISVEATDSWYAYDGGYPYTNMFDGDLNTKCWFNKDQEAGKEVIFTLPTTVNMTAIRIVQPSNVGNDVIDGADIQISTDKQTWTKVGELTPDELDTTVEFDETPVRYVRIELTATKKNWYQISEVIFTYTLPEADSTMADIIKEANGLDITGKDVDLVNTMINCLIDVQELYAAGSQDKEANDAAVAALRAAIDALIGAPVVEQHTVTVEAGAGGTATPSGSVTVTDGESLTITVTPNEGYLVKSVLVDGQEVTLTNNAYTIENVTADMTVQIAFEEISQPVDPSDPTLPSEPSESSDPSESTDPGTGEPPETGDTTILPWLMVLLTATLAVLLLPKARKVR